MCIGNNPFLCTRKQRKKFLCTNKAVMAKKRADRRDEGNRKEGPSQ